MTEVEWLASEDPEVLLDHLGTLDERKAFLLGIACARRVSHLLPEEQGTRLLDEAESRADASLPELDWDVVGTLSPEVRLTVRHLEFPLRWDLRVAQAAQATICMAVARDLLPHILFASAHTVAAQGWELLWPTIRTAWQRTGVSVGEQVTHVRASADEGEQDNECASWWRSHGRDAWQDDWLTCPGWTDVDLASLPEGVGDLIAREIYFTAMDVAFVVYDKNSVFPPSNPSDCESYQRWIQEPVLGAECGYRVRGPENAIQAILLRDIFGNPFRPITLASSHRTPTVASLAQGAYDERQLPSGELHPHRLAVLADALEEAGCADPEILGHLRGPGPHARGCHVVDLILGLTMPPVRVGITLVAERMFWL